MDITIKWLIIIMCAGVFFSNVEIMAKRVQYFNTERPNVTYFNRDYILFFNVSALRHSRRDPMHYIEVNIQTNVPAGNNYTLHTYFYEFLTNQYKRSFVEMHNKICNLIHINKLFSAVLGKFFPPTCPIPKGVYRLYNMTIPFDLVPRGFPFTKGRVYMDITDDYKNLTIAAGYIDAELKNIKI